MIYYVECIPPGTFLLQEMYSKYPLDDLELGCFFDGLLAFLREPNLGGRSAAGYGQMLARYRVQLAGVDSFELTSGQAITLPQLVQDAVEQYRKCVSEQKQVISDALNAQLIPQEAQDDAPDSTE